MVTLKELDSSKIQSDQSQDQTEKLTEVGYVMSYQVITGNRAFFGYACNFFPFSLPR